jgi:hypothetical protein
LPYYGSQTQVGGANGDAKGDEKNREEIDGDRAHFRHTA